MSGRVAIVGVGGLGCPAALGLARQGVSLGLFDPDRVEPSNLPRQLLYTEADLGRPKVEVAAERLRALVPGCDVSAFEQRIDERSASQLLAWPLWLDGTDSLAQKLWLSDLAVREGRTLIHGGGVGLRGQALAIVPGRGPCLRCLVGDGGEAEASCHQAGVLGPLVGLIGASMALLALQILRGDDLAGCLISYNAASGSLRQTTLARLSSCPVCRSKAPAADVETDVTGEICPMTFVRARLALEPLPAGGKLGVLLRGNEPLQNLPRSFRDEGHRILALEPREGGRHWLLVEKLVAPRGT